MPKSQLSKRPRLADPYSSKNTPGPNARSASITVQKSKRKSVRTKATPPTDPLLKSVSESSGLNKSIFTAPDSTDIVQKPRPKLTKLGNYNIEVPSDKNNCWITGIAVTKDGRRLFVDSSNKKVKLFSREMEILSCVSLNGEPWDIVMTGDEEAAVTCGHWLVLLHVSQLHVKVKLKIKMTFEMRGITRYQEKLIITTLFSDPRCMRLKDLTNKTDWSASSDKGQPLFNTPLYVSSQVGDRSAVAVTDGQKNMLTLLNGETGEVISRHQRKIREPAGITTDMVGNFYVCISVTHEVVLLNEDFTKEDTILSRRSGLSTSPQAITFDQTAQQLIVSYSMWNMKYRDSVDILSVSL